jgi:hypothetical protein
MYQKLILTMLLFATNRMVLYSQNLSFEKDHANMVRVFDSNGKLFENPNADAAGSRYFSDDWKYGIVTLNNDAVYSKRLLRLDLENQEVHYLENKTEMTLPAGIVKKVTFIDSSLTPATQYSFICELPPIDNQNEKSFYLILSDGKIKMLKCIRKKIIIEKNEFSGDSNKEYREYDDYYFFTGTSIQRIKKDKSYILGTLKNKAAEVEDYMKTNSLGFKSPQDLKKIIDYYNSLQ